MQYVLLVWQARPLNSLPSHEGREKGLTSRFSSTTCIILVFDELYLLMSVVCVHESNYGQL